MNWHFRWVQAEPTLEVWQRREYSHGAESGPRPKDHRDNHERVVGFEQPGPPEDAGIARRLADAILRFDVFPPHLLQSIVSRRPVEVGDVIGLRYHFVPGLDLVFAARVYDRFEESDATHWHCGFRYRTLQGHPACGEETFVVEKELATGRVTAALRSWSRPGIWIAHLTYPIMRTLQLRAARAALDHLQSLTQRTAERPVGNSRNLRTHLIW